MKKAIKIILRVLLPVLVVLYMISMGLVISIGGFIYFIYTGKFEPFFEKVLEIPSIYLEYIK